MAIFLRKESAGKDSGAFLNRIVAIDSIWTPWGSDDPFIYDCFKNGISDLGFRCGRLKTSDFCEFIDYMEISIGNCRNWDFYFDLIRKGDYFRVESTADWNEDPSFDGGPVCLIRFEGIIRNEKLADLNGENKFKIASEVTVELQKLINNFGCSVNIAKPGCFSFHPVNSDADRYRSVGSFNGFWSYIYEMNKQCEWPTFRQFSIPSVWDWYSKIPGVVTGEPSTSLSRAVAIYTRLFRQHYISDELQDIVWSVAGIESLLGESNYTVVGALKSKLRVIFPGIETAKIDIEKQIKKMYNVRSSLVHGSESLNGRFFIKKLVKRDEIVEDFSAGILLALLQVAYQRKIFEFKFEHVFI